MTMGSWHRSEQRRIHGILETFPWGFQDTHFGPNEHDYCKEFGLKYYPDFFILKPAKQIKDGIIFIELLSARRVMDERNAIRIRYWSKKCKELILITEGGIIQVLKDWLFFSGYFYDTYYIKEHMIRYHLQSKHPV